MAFLADVRTVGSDGIEFDVREPFKNSRRGLTWIPLVAPYGFGYQFRPGERVLVFVDRFATAVVVDNRILAEKGSLTITGCSGTKQATENDPDVSILRHLARRDAGGTVEGVLSRFDFRWLNYPGVRIRLRALSDDRRELVTWTGPLGGGFRFDWVRPGNYVVLLDGPPGVRDQQRLIYVAERQGYLRVPTFIISADEHRLLAAPE